MTADAAEIVRLAERVEQATGAYDDLFREAHCACFPMPIRIWEDEDREEWTAEYSQHHERSWAFEAFLDANAYLDAAMSLVPEGWRWTAGHREFPHARGYVENGELAFVGVGTRRNPNRLWFETTAATPALALTAAALRARAASALSDGEG